MLLNTCTRHGDVQEYLDYENISYYVESTFYFMKASL
jgi:hypothetical protein